MKKSRDAFTLVELLVVLGIIIIMAALVATGTQSVSLKSKSAKCLNNLRQIGVAAFTYAAEHDNELPQSSHQGPARAWAKVLRPYLDTRLFKSPLDDTPRALSYAMNDYLTESPFGAAGANFTRLHLIPRPAETLFMALLHPNQQNSDHFHFAERGFEPPSFQSDVWADAINQAGNYLFADGHVGQESWANVQARLGDPGSRFILPDSLEGQP